MQIPIKSLFLYNVNLAAVIMVDIDFNDEIQYNYAYAYIYILYFKFICIRSDSTLIPKIESNWVANIKRTRSWNYR